MTQKQSIWIGLGIVLALALFGRVLLLATNTVSFHSDEAVVALMARHILQGERPVFFYGQAYMGSLDAWLVALGFRLFGESVATIRLVQSALYLLVVATGYVTAWTLSRNLVVSAVTGLVLAVPPVLMAIYTTATLGGYNETLIIGNLLLLLSYEVTHEHQRSIWRWALLGFCAGLGWWANGLIIAYALPVGLLILKRLLEPQRHREDRENNVGARHASPEPRKPLLTGILIAAAAFIVGSAPWWIFALQNDLAPIYFYTGTQTPGAFAGADTISQPFSARIIGLFFLGLPALLGIRFPWSPDYFMPLFGVIVILIYAAALYRLARRPTLPSGSRLLLPDARLIIFSMIGLFCVLFLVSRFSNDPSGRYFLPLMLPIGIALGTLVASMRQRIVQIALVGVVLGYFAVGQISAAVNNPPGLTTQFNLITHIPNDDDAALVAFLDEHQLYNGYTNYWISFRLAFISGERMQYSATLPEKPDLSYTPFFERYPPYRVAADTAERVAYITANIPEVEAALETLFAQSGVHYETALVGVYRIYYDFDPPEAVPRPPFAFIQ